MVIVNEKILDIAIRDLMDADDGWGRQQGVELYNRILNELSNYPKCLIIRLSLHGVNRVDASFPRESIMEVIRRFKGEKGFCIIGVNNLDIIDNLDAAALKKGVSVTLWNQDSVQIIGPEVKTGLRKVLNHALQNDIVTASEVAETLNYKLNNASTKLKQLVDDGLLIRSEDSAASGGKEFLYFRIK